MGRGPTKKGLLNGAKRAHQWKRWEHDPFKSEFIHIDFKGPLGSRLQRYLKHPTAANIRVPARMFSPMRWGSGLDEMVQTRLQIANPKGFSPLALGELHQRERMPTTDLIWATGSNGVSPLAGHTPALKTHESRLTRGVIAEEHGARDALREKAIRQENLPVDWGIKARLATIKYMMSPGEELSAQQGRLSKFAEPIFSVHKRIGDLRMPKELSKLVDHQQEVREKLKWHTAREMLSTGHEGLVPATFQSYLATHDDPMKAMNAFRTDAHAKTVALNIAPTSQTDDLSSQSLSAMNTGRQRALSSPRLPAFNPFI
jgi:hypothetical protein